ncbi:MAG: alpha/beta hydrolase [Verrucomicrobia bacterium]|nr:alpha/beta hydrolase [Verrucomicrobiota bacterium]MBS0645376.1 alpha/beta hydrolase [Verrucomicrobiota bacterium]
MRLSSLFLVLCLSFRALFALDVNGTLYVKTKEHILWTESLGTWSPKAIICIAGAGAHARTWNNFFCEQLVEAGYFVIRFDNRDSGLSSSTPHPFGIEDIADDVIAILDAYRLPQAHVIGHSMGGMAAQFVAAKYPEYVKSMTVICSAPVGATDSLDRPLSLSETATLTQTLHLLATTPVSTDFENGFTAYKKRMQYFNGNYPVDESMAYSYIWDIYYRSNYKVRDQDIHITNVQKLMLTLDKRRDIFQKISAPTFIIHGAMDSLILPSRGGIPLHEALQGATLKIIPGMGHIFFNQTLISEMADDILEFIGEHEDAASISHLPKP